MVEKSIGRKIATSAAVLSASAALAGNTLPEASASQASAGNYSTSVEKYIESPARRHRIYEAVKGFAKAVLKQEQINGQWAPFDSFCYPSNNANGPEGWVSQGFHPTTKDDCALQHNPQYGGLGIIVSADMGIKPDGSYNSNNVTGANVIGIKRCFTTFDYEGRALGWDTTIALHPNARTDTDIAENSDTLAEAKRIDNIGIACLHMAEASLS